MTTPTSPAQVLPPCPGCGAPYEPGASFCEGCGRDLAAAATDALVPDRAGWAVADPVTAAAGEESPLDVGWTGPVAREPSGSDPSGGSPSAPPGARPPGTPGARCHACTDGHVADGYCDVCGAKARDPRDHYAEEPAAWVAGVCDIGRRHRRNEDALALHADPEPLSAAALVVCDGVSNTLDSDRASLAASRAALAVLAAPLARGAGTRSALVSAARARLDEAVRAARAAVLTVTAAADGDAGSDADASADLAVRHTEVDNPASCTVVAAVVADGVVVVGNVGDSRAYWLPDDPARPARQLSRDDSYAQELMSSGVPRAEAETGPGAHAITRWLGVDSPDDLTPHTSDLDLDHDGWLVVCSDGLWNYCSEAVDLQGLLHRTVADLGAVGHHPLTLAATLTDWANARGGVDNISVALARVGATTTPDPTATPRDDTKDTP